MFDWRTLHQWKSVVREASFYLGINFFSRRILPRVPLFLSLHQTSAPTDTSLNTKWHRVYRSPIVRWLHNTCEWAHKTNDNLQLPLVCISSEKVCLYHFLSQRFLMIVFDRFATLESAVYRPGRARDVSLAWWRCVQIFLVRTLVEFEFLVRLPCLLWRCTVDVNDPPLYTCRSAVAYDIGIGLFYKPLPQLPGILISCWC